MSATGVTGDLSELSALAENLRLLSEVPSQASREASETIAQLIEAEFDAGQDAYGNPWAPLKQSTLDRGRTPPPLTDTTDMRDTIDVSPLPGSGIKVTFDVPYAGYHQIGTRNMAARPPLPDGEALPPAWEAAIDTAAENAIRRRLSRFAR